MAYDHRTDPEWIEEQGKILEVQSRVEEMHEALVRAFALNCKLGDVDAGIFADTVGHIYFRVEDALDEVGRLYADTEEARATPAKVATSLTTTRAGATSPARSKRWRKSVSKR